MLYISFLSIFIRKFVKLVEAEYRSVLADVFCTDVASSALAYSAFHTKLKRCVDLSFFKAELCKSRKGEFNHYRRTA